MLKKELQKEYDKVKEELKKNKVLISDLKHRLDKKEKDIKTYNKLFERKNKKIKELKQELSTIPFRNFNNELRVMEEISKINPEDLKDWGFVNESGTPFLKYKKKILVNSVSRNGKEYEYPEDGVQYKQMYIEGLKIQLTHPNVLDNLVSYDKARHLHAEANHVCIGAIRGTGIAKALPKLPEILENVNMNSAMNCEVETYLISNFIRDGPKTKEEWFDYRETRGR